LFLYQTFIRIFSLVYDYCSKSNNGSTNSYPNKSQTKNQDNNSQNGANIVGEELYMNIKNYLTDYLHKICQVRSIYTSWNISKSVTLILEWY